MPGPGPGSTWGFNPTYGAPVTEAPTHSPPQPSTQPGGVNAIYQAMIESPYVSSMTVGETAGLKTKKMIDEKPEEKLYNLPLIKAFSRYLSGKVSDGEVGLEIECEGTNLFNTPVSYWSCHQDGSLRPHGEHPPIEYVLRKPLNREEIPKALAYLTAKLKATGSSIDDSPRTSVHVHVNCQKLTLKQVYQFICLYLIFEDLLVSFSGPDRIGNLFCLRAKDAEYQIIVLEQAVQKEDYRELFSNELRYSSCNVASLGKFGSLEFRSMRGTVDSKLIQQWVDILLLLRDKALEYSDPREIVEDFISSSPERLFSKVFKSRPDLGAELSIGSDLHTSLWDGLRLMRDVAYAVDWQEAKKKYSEKDFEEIKVTPPDRAYQGMVYITPCLRAGYAGYWYVVNPDGVSHEFIRPGYTSTTIILPIRKFLYTPQWHYETVHGLDMEDI